MSRRFAVVHEAEADFEIATQLADRVLQEAIEWLEDHLIEHQREWVKKTPENRRLTWTAVTQLARELGIKARGHFDGEPSEPDACTARRAILCLKQTIPDLSAILLIRDQDKQPERRKGLDQARNEDHKGLVIVVGLAVMEREAWVISGFIPQDDDEEKRLLTERRKLGFLPNEESHELTAGDDDDAQRSPKRVLKALTGGVVARERQCWTHTPLKKLRDRGKQNGLVLYLDEIVSHLVPLIK